MKFIIVLLAIWSSSAWAGESYNDRVFKPIPASLSLFESVYSRGNDDPKETDPSQVDGDPEEDIYETALLRGQIYTSTSQPLKNQVMVRFQALFSTIELSHVRGAAPYFLVPIKRELKASEESLPQVQIENAQAVDIAIAWVPTQKNYGYIGALVQARVDLGQFVADGLHQGALHIQKGSVPIVDESDERIKHKVIWSVEVVAGEITQLQVAIEQPIRSSSIDHFLVDLSQRGIKNGKMDFIWDSNKPRLPKKTNAPVRPFYKKWKEVKAFQ